MKKTCYALITTLMVLALAACNMPRSSSSAEETAAFVNTSVAETVNAEVIVTDQPTDEPPTAATNTPEPAAEDTPVVSPSPVSNTATPTNTPIPCNLARFVDDVTIPDGTEFEPGDAFTKTWSLRNIGSCSWTSGYNIVFSGGDAMGAPSAVQVTSGTVGPGQIVQVSVDLTAPGSAGTYRGNWQMRDPSDVIFGIENSTSGYFWVEIEVIEEESATLHRTSYSKYMSVGGRSNGTRLGIAPNGDAIRAFLDYDLSELAGLDLNSTIVEATLDMSDFTGNSCFEFLHPLKAGVIAYGAIADYPADFNKVPTATLFSVPSGAEIATPVDITSILQDFVDSEGNGHFQFRMELEHDDAGAAFNCMMEWDDPLLNVTYQP